VSRDLACARARFWAKNMMMIRVDELKKIASEVRAACEEAVQERMVGGRFALKACVSKASFIRFGN
jgi:hypothetical protein